MEQTLTLEMVREKAEAIAAYIRASWKILGGKHEKVFSGWRGINRAGLRVRIVVPGNQSISWELEELNFKDGRAQEWSVFASGDSHNLLDIPPTCAALLWESKAIELIAVTLQDLVRVAREEFYSCAERFAPRENAEMWRTLDRMFILAEEREIMLGALSGIRADCLASWKIVGKNKFIGRMRQRVEEAFDRIHTIETVRKLETERI